MRPADSSLCGWGEGWHAIAPTDAAPARFIEPLAHPFRLQVLFLLYHYYNAKVRMGCKRLAMLLQFSCLAASRGAGCQLTIEAQLFLWLHARIATIS